MATAALCGMVTCVSLANCLKILFMVRLGHIPGFTGSLAWLTFLGESEGLNSGPRGQPGSHTFTCSVRPSFIITPFISHFVMLQSVSLHSTSRE